MSVGPLASPHEPGDNRASTWEATRDPILPFVLIAAGLLLVAALSLDVVRTAYGVKGDEASYVTMALSVAHDGDLAFERRDLLRFWRVYGRGPDGIFLKRSAGRELSLDRRWPFVHVSRTAVIDPDRLYFGKAFIYSLVAAPFVKLFGLNGLWVFHVLLLVGVVVAGATFAATRMPRPAAWLVAGGFVGGSIVPLYGIWLTSEIFNFSLIFFGYFAWLYKEVRAAPGRGAAGLLRGSRSDLAAATLLGLATFSKPSNVLLVLPLIGLALWRKRMLDGLGVGVVFVAVVLGGFGANAIVSREWNYQGGDRRTFFGRFPFEGERANFDELGVGVSTNEIAVRETSRTYLTQFGHNVVYLFAGRHFGLLPYFFPGMFIAAWAFWRRRTLAGWHVMIAVATAATAFGLLVMLPNTWSGGGGPAGNRYFLSVYPTLFFLLPAARSMVPGIVAWLGGLLFVAHILVDPFVAVKRPWLYGDRGLLRALPVELTMVNDLPVMLDQGSVADSLRPRSRVPALFSRRPGRAARRVGHLGVRAVTRRSCRAQRRSVSGVGGRATVAGRRPSHPGGWRRQSNGGSGPRAPGLHTAAGEQRLRPIGLWLRAVGDHPQRIRAPLARFDQRRWSVSGGCLTDDRSAGRRGGGEQSVEWSSRSFPISVRAGTTACQALERRVVV